MQEEYDPADFWKPKGHSMFNFESGFRWECPYRLHDYDDSPINMLEKEIHDYLRAQDRLKKEKRMCINGIIASAFGMVITLAVFYASFPEDMRYLAHSFYDIFAGKF